MTVSVVLLDLDGVIRHFDPGVPVAAERRTASSPARWSLPGSPPS